MIYAQSKGSEEARKGKGKEMGKLRRGLNTLNPDVTSKNGMTVMGGYREDQSYLFIIIFNY